MLWGYLPVYQGKVSGGRQAAKDALDKSDHLGRWTCLLAGNDVDSWSNVKPKVDHQPNLVDKSCCDRVVVFVWRVFIQELVHPQGGVGVVDLALPEFLQQLLGKGLHGNPD